MQWEALINERGVCGYSELVKKKEIDALLELILAQKQDCINWHIYICKIKDALDAMEEMIIIVYERIYHTKGIRFYS